MQRPSGASSTTAHGRATRHDGSGIVFDVESGRDLVTGLACPHHPRRSTAHGSCATPPGASFSSWTTRVASSVDLELRSWTRGLAVAEGTFFVGESSTREGAG